MEIIQGRLNGFCYGVKRAVDGAFNFPNGVFCLGELVHNKQVLDNLEKKNIKIINNLSDVEDNTTVIVRAHGIEKNIYKEAEERNIRLIDYTCPNVSKVHHLCEEYRDKNYYIFIVGVDQHPETIGNISFCGNNYSLVTGFDNLDSSIEKYNNSSLSKSMIIFQTSFNTVIAKQIIDYITKIIPGIEIKNTICSSTELRQNEAIELSKKVDMMIIVGGKNSSNTTKLFDISRANCNNTIFIQTKDDLKDITFNNINKLGIISGASTPGEIVDEIVQYIKMNEG